MLELLDKRFSSRHMSTMISDFARCSPSTPGQMIKCLYTYTSSSLSSRSQKRMVDGSKAPKAHKAPLFKLVWAFSHRLRVQCPPFEQGTSTNCPERLSQPTSFRSGPSRSLQRNRMRDKIKTEIKTQITTMVMKADIILAIIISGGRAHRGKHT